MTILLIGFPSTYSYGIDMKGISYTAWQPEAMLSPESDASLAAAREAGSNWIAICVWWFQDDVNSTVIEPDYTCEPDEPDDTCYSATPDSVVHAIQTSHNLGMKVMLKPMVDCQNGVWRGEINPSAAWFNAYQDFINFWADIAEQNNVELFSVGCELKNTISWDSSWRNTILEVRTHYTGPLTYAANHGQEQNVSWWDELNYIGIDAYYPLTTGDAPSLETLKSRWNSIADSIEAWRNSNWPTTDIIFTEVGYQSVDGTNRTPWWTDPATHAIDMQEQAQCYEALLSQLKNRSWWLGMFWWNWETSADAGGLGDPYWTPQNKLAELIMRNYYLTDGTLVTVKLSDIDSGLTSPQGDYRWLDVANHQFSGTFIDNYDYTQAEVTVTYEIIDDRFQGTLTAANLKPNFAYQLKLNGIAGTATNERIGLAGRWWQEEWNGSDWVNGQNLNNKGDGSSPNPNDDLYFVRKDNTDYKFTGYLMFDYFITNENGDAIVSFEADSSYHVLWATNDSDVYDPPGVEDPDYTGHRDRSSNDGPLEEKTFDADLSAAYEDTGGDDFPPRTVAIFGEWERLPVGGVFPEIGDDFEAQLVLTEESFHGSGGQYAGGWAAAMGGDIPPRPYPETGIASGVTNSGWTTVNLEHDYDSMVVVCSPNYDKDTPPLVVRVQNASGNRFEVSVDRADSLAGVVSGIDVHYLVVEEGVYTEATRGVKMEAVKFTSTLTDRDGSWIGESRTYANTYSNPAVVGQVMSANDPNFSVFWSCGTTHTNPPTGSALWVGKHIGEDPDKVRSNETIGYIVIEAGTGVLNGRTFQAGLGDDLVGGITNNPPYTYPLSGMPAASVAIVSSAGMDGGNGGWPVLHGPDPVTASSLNLAIDEDQLKDAERSHITEQVAYIIFGPPVGAPPTIETFTANPDIIVTGGLSTLAWSTNAASVSIDNWVGDDFPASGNVSVSPTETTTYTLTATGPTGDSTAQVTVTVTDLLEIPFETGVVYNISNSSWTTVNLEHDYDSMVVVCSPNYDKDTPPLVVRVQNASGNRFEVSVDRADSLAGVVSGIDVHYLVVEEGVYTEATRGVKMEAVKFTSTLTDRDGSWIGESRTYANTYSNPAVVGQVMSANDPNFSVFWSCGTTHTNPPTGSALWVGKHIGEDPDKVRSNETIGYIVIEAGTGVLNGRTFQAGLGDDLVGGITNNPPYTYPLSGMPAASVAIVSSAGMDGGNGGWPVLHGPDPVTASSLNLAIDEDQLKDAERSHITEQVGYIVFE